MEHTGEQVRVPLATNGADQVQFPELGNEVHGELASVPAIHSDGLDLTRKKLPDLGEAVLLFPCQHLLKGVEVAVGIRKVGGVECSVGHIRSFRGGHLRPRQVRSD
ncbi:hypothetical protein D3C73_1238410 [compost metagenome]